MRYEGGGATRRTSLRGCPGVVSTFVNPGRGLVDESRAWSSRSESGKMRRMYPPRGDGDVRGVASNVWGGVVWTESG
jgi:hypothetical protein